MVGFAVNVPTVSTEHSVRTEDTSWHVEAPEGHIALSLKKPKSTVWKPTGEEPKSQTIDVPGATSFNILSSRTSAEVPFRARETNDTNYFVVYSSKLGQIEASKSRLVELPSRGRLVTSFEPHFRQSTVQNLQGLFTQFQHSIGKPSATILKAELVDALTSTYRKTALNPETRNFASAVSLLQDFLRPHWSELKPETVDAVCGSLNALVSRKELTPNVLEGFYRQLLRVVGTGISVEVETEDEALDDENE